MNTLAIDIETFSDEDLGSCGVYRYAESKNFEVLLFAYAVDDGPVEIIDLVSGEQLPPEITEALWDEKVIKIAFNAQFERACLARHLNKYLPAEQWQCTKVHAAMMGLPSSLSDVAQALGLHQQKMKDGPLLIRYFSMPCKATKANGGRMRNMPSHDPGKWALFKAYCMQDVTVERNIHKSLANYPVPSSEWELWCADQLINEGGVMISRPLVDKAVAIDEALREELIMEAKRLTGLVNPNSQSQLLAWLTSHSVSCDSVTKDDVTELLNSNLSPEVRRVLEIRAELAKTSVKKYTAMAEAVCADDRLRGLLQFYGARTGRWAGRIVQPQNLARISMDDHSLHKARELVLAGDSNALAREFGSIAKVLSQLIRTAFIAAPGHVLIVADLAAIEARCVAWLAGERWALEEFAGEGKIYEATASRMYNVPKESITKSSPLRQKGKAAALACGYGGGVGALRKMGAERDGLSAEEMQQIVDAWREANPNIVQLWRKMESAAIRAIAIKQASPVREGVVFNSDGHFLQLSLPSGRYLYYAQPHVRTHATFNRPEIAYQAVNGVTKKWETETTYGGKLVENMTQAVARDIMAMSILNAQQRGYKVLLTVHDELVCEVPEGKGSAAELAEIMTEPVPWAPGLPLAAASSESIYYHK